MRTGNPALNDRVFQNYAGQGVQNETMTLQGTINKTLILVGIALVTASYTWGQYLGGNTQMAMMVAVGGAVGGLITGLICAFKPASSPITAPLYALFEGLFLGGFSGLMEMRFPGIVIQAVALTFGTLVVLLIAYKTQLIKVTENLRLGITAATGAIALFYFVTFILSFFGIHVPYIHESGLIGIGFSLFVVAIAAMNLVLDFDFIENGSNTGAPKFMEWYAGFGLLVTLIWLYIEILRLLSKLRSR
ncbi:MAG: Bax inhibitor-1/YccA family protein [Spirochaetia bacterium]|nr:Bax inhibitor-1/YccA family protein [Spirochaetia bacterium]